MGSCGQRKQYQGGEPSPGLQGLGHGHLGSERRGRNGGYSCKSGLCAWAVPFEQPQGHSGARSCPRTQGRGCELGEMAAHRP